MQKRCNVSIKWSCNKINIDIINKRETHSHSDGKLCNYQSTRSKSKLWLVDQARFGLSQPARFPANEGKTHGRNRQYIPVGWTNDRLCALCASITLTQHWTTNWLMVHPALSIVRFICNQSSFVQDAHWVCEWVKKWLWLSEPNSPRETAESCRSEWVSE